MVACTRQNGCCIRNKLKISSRATKKLMKTLRKLIHTILSISGFVPENMTFLRAFFMIGSLAVSAFVLPTYSRLDIAIIYFTCSTVVYIGFIFVVLRERGLRLAIIEKFGEEKAYLYYEGF